MSRVITFREIAPVFALLALVSVSSESATISCGDTLGPGGVISIDNSIDGCSTASGSPALTLIGPVEVDLRGNRVACDASAPPVGILIKGRGAKLLNGQVFDCKIGVKVSGKGRHEIAGINADSHRDTGFLVTSGRNNIHDCAGNDADVGDGFTVRGRRNELFDNSGVHNGENGFDLRGNLNRLRSSVAVDNGSDGIEVGGRRNEVLLNSSASNAGDGFEVNGDNNQLSSNVSTRNVGNGFFIKALVGSADSNTIDDNSAVENLEDGYRIAGQKNTFSGNRAFDNGSDGFEALLSSALNVFDGNLSVGHEAAGAGYKDMQDNHRNCGSNTWTSNLFKTSLVAGGANPGCLK